MEKLLRKIKNYVPAGYNVERELSIITAGYIICCLLSAGYYALSLRGRIQNLYWINGSVKRLKDDAVMPLFREVLGKSLDPFIILLCVTLFFIILHYEYHKAGSMSIYLMKRLPKRNELMTRCITLPIALSAFIIITAAILLLVFFAAYYFLTPEGLIPVF